MRRHHSDHRALQRSLRWDRAMRRALRVASRHYGRLLHPAETVPKPRLQPKAVAAVRNVLLVGSDRFIAESKKIAVPVALED
jgi:hypothetical protein